MKHILLLFLLPLDTVILFFILVKLIKIPGNRKLLNVYDTKKHGKENIKPTMILVFGAVLVINIVVFYFYQI